MVAGSPIKKGEEAYRELAIKQLCTEDAGPLILACGKGAYDYSMLLLDFVHILAKVEAINLEMLV